MAPLTTILLSSLLPMTLVSASTVQFDIAASPQVRSAQLQARSLYRRSVALDKRAGTVAADLTNSFQQGLYFANVSVGTPAQKFALQIDTGSSDVWVPAASTSLCSTTAGAKQGGCPDGKFSSSDSTTFVDVGRGDFNISYVDGSGSTGDYFQDTFTIGGASLTNFEMGLALDTTIGTGIMGIGYNSSEANIDTGNGTTYANLPIALVNQGKINSAAYSLWLNDLQSSTGSILFGGIDTAKYTGDLMSINVYPSTRRGGVTSFTVALTSISATSSSGSDLLTPNNYAVAAILDSGTTITLLPDDLAHVIFEELGATEEPQLGVVAVPCALSKNTGTINYGFGGTGGPTIKVAISDLILPLTDSKGNAPKYTNGQAACQLGIQAAGKLPVLLGDTFLRSAYAVYDLINNRIALAQTNFNTTKSNIVSFASNGAQIPSATSAPNEAQVTQTNTAVPKVGVNPTVTGTGVAATYNPTATGLSAMSGFTSTSASGAGTTKKSVAGKGIEPFKWAQAWVGAVSVALMGVGAGVFAAF